MDFGAGSPGSGVDGRVVAIASWVVGPASTEGSPQARPPPQADARSCLGRGVRPSPCATLGPVNTTVRTARSDPATGRAAQVAVEVGDPELDADVRAVLAALALDAAAPGDQAVDLVVTDRAGPGRGAGGGPGVGSAGGGGGVRAVRVAPDRARVDDDEVVHLPSEAGDLVTALMAPTHGTPGAQVVVFGAVGGCGASTLAAALAVRAAASGRTLLLEADPCGTGADLVLGVETEPGLRVEGVRADLGGPDPDALWAAVPKARPGLGVLARSRARGETAARGAVSDGGPGAARSHRAAGGLVVSDAGVLGEGGPGAVGSDVVVVVTRADLQGAVAAGRAVRRFPEAILVVRTGRGDPLHAADVAESTAVVRWFVLPEIRGVRRAAGAGGLVSALDRGRAGGVRRLAAVADALLEEVVPDGR